MQKIYSIIMTKSVLQEFFDEFDKDRDPNLPPRLVGITNYLFDLGKTSSVVFQRTAIIENPLRGFGFSEIVAVGLKTTGSKEQKKFLMLIIQFIK